MALQVALLLECGVDARRERGKDAQLDERADEVHAKALEHDVDEDLPDGHDDERIRPAPGVAAVALDEGPAKEDERDRGHERQHGSDAGHGGGEREVAADEDLFLAEYQAIDHDTKVRAHERQGHDAVERAEGAVDADHERDGPALLGGGIGGVEVVARQVVVGVVVRVGAGMGVCRGAARCLDTF